MRIFTERFKHLLEIHAQRTADLGQEMETEVVWPHLRAFWLGKGDSTGHSDR